jgi:hypothetical protein
MAASQLHKVDLGEAGTEYLRKRLSEGLSLSRAVLRELNVRQGDVVTYAPPEIPQSALSNFDQGGVMGAERSQDHIERVLGEAMSSHEQNVLVAENRLAKRDDPVLRRRRVRTFIFGDETYHWTSARTEIDAVLRSAASHWLTCFVTSIEHELGASPSAKDLQWLATKVELLAISAYDEEGYVVWSARGSSSRA